MPVLQPGDQAEHRRRLALQVEEESEMKCICSKSKFNRLDVTAVPPLLLGDHGTSPFFLDTAAICALLPFSPMRKWPPRHKFSHAVQCRDVRAVGPATLLSTPSFQIEGHCLTGLQNPTEPAATNEAFVEKGWLWQGIQHSIIDRVHQAGRRQRGSLGSQMILAIGV